MTKKHDPMDDNSANLTVGGGPSPIIVGGSGGSGTRLIRSLLSESGVFMGTDDNEAGDTLVFSLVLQRSINPILMHTHALDYTLSQLSQDFRETLLSDFSKAARHHAILCPPSAIQWGWKNPRCMFVLPLLHEIYPQMRFIHVVRDGYDMAFSSNQRQPQRYFRALFDEARADMTCEDFAQFWARVNTDVLRWTRRELGNRCLIVRLEDMCDQPEKSIGRLLEWAGLPVQNMSALCSLVKRPQSLGRWRQQDPAVIAKLERFCGAARASFGYSSAENISNLG